MQSPDIEQQARGDAEAHHVRQRIELGAELAGCIEKTRDPAIERIEHRGNGDGRHGKLPALQQGKPDRGHTGTEAEQRQDIGDQPVERLVAKP